MTPLQVALKWMLYPLVRSYIRMPGRSYRGALAPLSIEEQELKTNLQRHVSALAVAIGERHIRNQPKLDEAADYVAGVFRSLGYTVRVEEFFIDGNRYQNLEVEIRGSSRPDEIVVIGAHYDTVFGSPGADDNSSGVAALLELARLYRGEKTDRTLRLVAFSNEEHPTHPTGWNTMGSYAYARGCHQRGENVVGMLSLEMLGVYSDAAGSQAYPFPFNLFYPTTANFLGFVGNTSSRALVHKCIGSFRKHTAFPSEGAAAPEKFKDIGRSDHWAFWQFGYQALMVTDTSNFRYRLYHTHEDTPDKLDFDRFARVTAGLARMTSDLVRD